MPSKARNHSTSNSNTAGRGTADFSRGVTLVTLILLGIAAVILAASAGGTHPAYDAL